MRGGASCVCGPSAEDSFESMAWLASSALVVLKELMGVVPSSAFTSTGRFGTAKRAP